MDPFALAPNALPPDLANLVVVGCATVLAAWLVYIFVNRSALADVATATDGKELLRLPGAGRHVQALADFSRFHLQQVLRRSHAESSCVVGRVLVPGGASVSLRSSAPPTVDTPSLFVDARSGVPATATVYWAKFPP